MKELKYNKKSWHAWLWANTYGDNIYGEPNLPRNICTYFWTLLIAIILAIPNYIGIIVNVILDRKNERRVNAFWFLFHYFFFTAAGAAYTDKLNIPIHGLKNLWKIYLYGWPGMLIFTGFVIVTCIIFAILYFICKGVQFLYNKIIKPKPYITSNPLIDGWKAFKGKYCSKIQWN